MAQSRIAERLKQRGLHLIRSAHRHPRLRIGELRQQPLVHHKLMGHQNIPSAGTVCHMAQDFLEAFLERLHTAPAPIEGFHLRRSGKRRQMHTHGSPLVGNIHKPHRIFQFPFQIQPSFLQNPVGKTNPLPAVMIPGNGQNRHSQFRKPGQKQVKHRHGRGRRHGTVI